MRGERAWLKRAHVNGGVDAFVQHKQESPEVPGLFEWALADLLLISRFFIAADAAAEAVV